MNTFQLEFIRGKVPTREQLAQLAEEAAELAQAALKLRRALDGTNPTPVSIDTALDNLKEEIADVCLQFDVLNIDIATPEHRARKTSKLQRWVDRIKEKQEGWHG